MTETIQSHFRKIHHTIYLLVPQDLAHLLKLQHNQPVELTYTVNPHGKIIVKIKKPKAAATNETK